MDNPFILEGTVGWGEIDFKRIFRRGQGVDGALQACEESLAGKKHIPVWVAQVEPERKKHELEARNAYRRMLS
ncbi:hypothetical protein P4B35_11590 [Pontiellaceae bacterium B12227]|nr:hypothetical protein [Pontiellaceae bacterium B12227]